MSLKKNWFYYISMSIAMIGMLYIIVCGLGTLGEGQEYPYIPKGLLLIGIFSTWMIATLATRFIVKVKMTSKINISFQYMKYAEIVFIILILAVAVIVRIIVLNEFPMKPESDYKTYYEIAELLFKGTIQKEGKGYCDYVAMFPHVMGYCYILKTLFTFTGVSVAAGQYLNLVFSIASILLTYKIARKLGGKLSGIIALVLCAFWPSQVLYITMLSAEYSFTFFLLLCIWIFISLVKDYDGNTRKSVQGIILHLLLGVLIAITSAIRPMALIFLIAILIAIFPQKMKLPIMPKNNIPLTIRVLEKGWVRCLLILVPYIIISGVITTNIELTVDRTLPSASTSFGYNLLVGLNTDSKGGWNDEDAALLYSSMEETGSASQAHITCRDLAFQRLVSNPKGIFNLFINKYELLWGNDDYGATWNISFLDEQGNLTEERSDFLYNIRDINNILYVIIAFFALLALIYLWKTDGNYAYILVLIFLGTAAMHLFVESQNRYHYFVLQIFMILAGMGVQLMYQDAKIQEVQMSKRQLAEKAQQIAEDKIMDAYKREEKVIEALRAEAFSNVFDMQEALKNGNVIMTVTKAYEEKLDTNKPNIEKVI